MRLAWTSTFSLDHRRGGWPAAHAHLHGAIQTRGVDVLPWFPLHAPDDVTARWLGHARAALTGRRSLATYSTRRLDAFAAAFRARQSTPAPDAVLFFSVPDFLRVFPACPAFVYTDSAFVPFLERYHAHRNYRAAELRRLAALEESWLRRLAGIFTSSQQAARAIMERYRIPPERLDAVGIGANLPPPAPPCPRGGDSRNSALFVCTDFSRKGGARVLAAVAHARSRLPDLTLDIVGDYPADAVRRDFVRAHGWIDRNTPAGAARFAELMRTNGLFLQLSREDLTPTAICEASAYGLPTLASAVGGIPEMVADNMSGWLVPADASAALIGERIVAALADPVRRESCGLAARRAYEERWNWDRVAERIVAGIVARLPGSPS